jgi:hypothetical protein
MARLTYQQRKKLPKSQFAIPGRAPKPGSYPLDTANRARNALSRVSQYGSPAEKATVRAAVHRRYPNIGRAKKRRAIAAMRAG